MIKWCTGKECNSTDAIDDHVQESPPVQIPIVYSHKYSVKFCGLEKLHPFDAAKGYHIFERLKLQNIIEDDSVIFEPNEISKKDLLTVHTPKYIKSLKCGFNVAKIAEMPLFILVPNCFIQRSYLRPMRYQTAGSVLAGKLAVKYGWAINLGGGFHHCCATKGSGFCPYADITLLIKTIQMEDNGIHNIMIIDLDAHQGNGHERDFLNDSQVYILDIYNCRIFPKDIQAKKSINRCVELLPFTEDEQYLRLLKLNLKKSFEEFHPDMIVFNAGTDILEGDPLGLLSITPKGVIERDEIIFEIAAKQNIPIVMLLSGGYLRTSAKVISDSIGNLFDKGYFRIRC